MKTTKRFERPWSRIPTAPPRVSGRFEAKMATSSVRVPPPPCNSETPRAMFSGTPSSVTAARIANPDTRPLYVAVEQPVRRHEGRRPYQEPDAASPKRRAVSIPVRRYSSAGAPSPHDEIRASTQACSTPISREISAADIPDRRSRSTSSSRQTSPPLSATVALLGIAGRHATHTIARPALLPLSTRKMPDSSDTPGRMLRSRG